MITIFKIKNKNTTKVFVHEWTPTAYNEIGVSAKSCFSLQFLEIFRLFFNFALRIKFEILICPPMSADGDEVHELS